MTTELVCRGSYALGTACGKCSRCEAERAKRDHGLPEVTKTPPMPECKLPKQSATRNEAQEAALIIFGNRWKLDKDLLICRGCKRGIIYCRRNETVNHAAGCRFADDERNPWAVLHAITAENYA